MAPAVPTPSVTDFVASDDLSGRVTLSWTQSSAPGDTSAVVLRRDDRFPTSAMDGEVVFTGSGLTPGAPVVAEDPFTGHGYYTVLVGGDAGFGEGAWAGQNADEGTGLAADGDTDESVDLTEGPGGCGCDNGSGVAGWVGLVGALAALRRRRW